MLAVMLAASFLFLATAPVKAQGISAGELIQAVNALRATHGLAPYQTDNYWTGIAQVHSEYQASINSVTHTRADGTGPGDHNISSENIGGGYVVTTQILFNQWTDYWHTFTLLGFSSGKVGAGAAAGSDGYLYYTLIVKNTGELTGLPDTQPAQNTPGANTTQQTAQPTPEPLVTATPQEDGSIIHTVGPGETLWEIAISYDVVISQLASLNLLDAENPVIYPGDTIIIRTGYTPTPTATITNTPLPPTRTLRPSRTPQPERSTETPGAMVGVTEAPAEPENTLITRQNMNVLGITTIILGFLGAAALIFGWVWSRKNG